MVCSVAKCVICGSPPRRARGWKSRDRSVPPARCACSPTTRSEEHTSELQSLMRISYAVFCLKKKRKKNRIQTHHKFYTEIITVDTQKRNTIHTHNNTLTHE